MGRGTLSMTEAPAGGTLNIGIKVDLKGALVLGGVVYFAARAAVRRELKKGSGQTTFYQTVVQPAKEVFDSTVSDVRKAAAEKSRDDRSATVAEVKRMRYEDQMSIQDIAVGLGIPESAVRSYLDGEPTIPQQPTGE